MIGYRRPGLIGAAFIMLGVLWAIPGRCGRCEPSDSRWDQRWAGPARPNAD
jgi:hypothetical protein